MSRWSTKKLPVSWTRSLEVGHRQLAETKLGRDTATSPLGSCHSGPPIRTLTASTYRPPSLRTAHRGGLRSRQGSVESEHHLAYAVDLDLRHEYLMRSANAEV